MCGEQGDMSWMDFHHGLTLEEWHQSMEKTCHQMVFFGISQQRLCLCENHSFWHIACFTMKSTCFSICQIVLFKTTTPCSQKLKIKNSHCLSETDRMSSFMSFWSLSRARLGRCTWLSTSDCQGILNVHLWISPESLTEQPRKRTTERRNWNKSDIEFKIYMFC